LQLDLLPDQPRQPARPRRGGRPRLPGAKITSIELSREERAVLDELADQAGVPLSEIWRRALRLYAAAQDTPWTPAPPRPQPGESAM
jgi:hypothetical protein